MNKSEIQAEIFESVRFELKEEAVPLLFQKREYLEAIDSSASTTSCQTTRSPVDYGPDD